MYCFQCGEELVDGAKFCHVCGANQEESRKLFEKKFKKSSPDHDVTTKGAGGDTKVAHSSDPDDGAYLKSYLDKVDTHVGENIKKHETLSGMEKADASQKSESIRPADEQGTSEAAKRDEAPEAEKIAPADEADREPKKKKRSFSSIWRRFIDEEDNPYSVFGDMADRLEREEEAISPDESDRLRISQDMDEDPTARTGDVSSLNRKVNAILDEQEQEDEKKLTTKGILHSFFSKDRKKKADTEEATGAMDDATEVITPVDADAVSDEPMPEATVDSEADIEEATTRDSEGKISPRDSFKGFMTNIKDRVAGGENHTHTPISDLFEVDEASNKLELARSRVLEKGDQGIRGLFGIGIVISALPVFFAFRRIGILPIVFIVLKVLIDLFAFYFANNVARRNTCEADALRTRYVDNLLHWILYLIPATVIFFILPSSFAMGRTVLGSVTPHILVSILLYIWVLFLALSSVQKILPKRSTVEFLAWYGIIFVSIDLISKLFWIIAIFLTSTFA